MMNRISQDEILSFLAKSRVVKPEAKALVPAKPAAAPERAIEPIRSVMLNPYSRLMYKGTRNVIEPNRKLDYRILRVVAERAWIINAIIGHQINQARPFLKPSTDNNIRGFQIRLKDGERAPSAREKELMKGYTDFFLRTGFGSDPDREDDLTNFSAKVIRDLLTLDQVTTELQRTQAGKLYAFWAVDPATVFKCSEEGYNGDDRIRFVQEVDLQVTAYYTRNNMIFDYQNPRTDIEHAGYGYSVVEQAIDLITGMINSFMYNMGFFTEDRLPRGMLLLQGDADMEEVEMIEDYLVNIMSGGPMSKWRVPIIPAGSTGNGSEGRKFEWVSLQGSNKDMEFTQWTEFLWSSVAALFGIDLEELGIRTSKSTSVIPENPAPRLEASKSRGLAAVLSFLESHYQKILDRLDPRFDFEFIGYEKDDPGLKNTTMEAELRSIKSIDQLLAERDQKPFNQPWSKIPLNPYVVQMVMAAQGQGQGGQEGAGEAPTPRGAEEYAGGDEEGKSDSEDAMASYRKLLMGDGGQEEGAAGAPEALKASGQKASGQARPGGGARGAGQAEDGKRSIFDEMGKSISDDVIEIIV